VKLSHYSPKVALLSEALDLTRLIRTPKSDCFELLTEPARKMGKMGWAPLACLSILDQHVNRAKLFFDLRDVPDAARVRFSIAWGRHHRPAALAWHDRNLDGRGTVGIGRQSFAKNPDQVGARNSFLGQQ
jgi:hypothetical protein